MLRNVLIEELLEDDLNLNAVGIVVECIAQFVNAFNNFAPRNEAPVRNENYYENIIHHYNMDDFAAHFRMKRETFQTLLNYLQQLRNVEDVIPFEKKLLFSIWVLAKQESFLAVGDRFNIAKSTGHYIFFEIISQIANLRNEFIVWPNYMERQRTSRVLREKSGIPGIIGAIDGTHIAIKAPPYNSIDYYNRNNYHSVILQAVCNDKREFIDVFAGIAGRVHDARVFRLSPLFTLLTGNNPPIDENQHLLGDNAYPLLPFLMKPYRDNGHLTPEKTRFNTILSSIRCIIEHTFGLLKEKWRRLKFLDMARIDLTPTVIVAACVLHNFILKNQDLQEDLEEEEEEEDYDNEQQNEEENENNLQIFEDYGIAIGDRKRNYIASILR